MSERKQHTLHLPSYVPNEPINPEQCSFKRGEMAIISSFGRGLVTPRIYYGDYEGDTLYPKTRYIHHKLAKRPGLGQRKMICYKDRFELFHDAEGHLTRL